MKKLGLKLAVGALILLSAGVLVAANIQSVTKPQFTVETGLKDLTKTLQANFDALNAQGLTAPTVTKSSAAITATGTVSLVQSRVSLTDTNGVTAEVVTNVAGTVAITVLNGGSVLTNLTLSIP